MFKAQASCGTVPTRSFVEKATTESAVRRPISVGIVPVADQ